MSDESPAARDELDELRGTVSRLMRGLNHDLKNPIGAADGYLELLLEGYRGDLSDDQRQAVGRVRELLASAIRILEDVVTYARASLGELTVRPAEADLNAIVRLVVEEQRERADSEGVVMEVETGAEAQRTITDQERVAQILRQLLANALDHTPAEGHVEIGVRRLGDDFGVFVKDTGPGIPEDERDRIFLEFERGSPPVHARETGGLGFGLPLARALADQLEGRLQMESEVGSGSTFTLVLPAR